jgi:molybdopterin synthase sulfur carrier subunit
VSTAETLISAGVGTDGGKSAFATIVNVAIEVRIPTILRNYTAGEKAVEGKGATLGDLFSDLDTRYDGLRARLVGEEGNLNRFVNVYLNDEDVRFLGGVETPLSDGDVVTILPAVAGGAAEAATAVAGG